MITSKEVDSLKERTINALTMMQAAEKVLGEVHIEVNRQILLTPTGKLRNDLTAINLELMAILERLK